MATPLTAEKREAAMRVQEIMKTNVAACAPGDTLADVAKLMRDRNCGFVPVVNSEGVVTGVVTDRDLGLAVGGSTRAAERISALEVMSRPVFGCFADENLKVVLATMGTHHVRRLVVLDKQHGHLVGVLSLDDVAVLPRRNTLPTGDEIADAFKHIVSPVRMS
jgi:CBS domain-containing protein